MGQTVCPGLNLHDSRLKALSMPIEEYSFALILEHALREAQSMTTKEVARTFATPYRRHVFIQVVLDLVR